MVASTNGRWGRPGRMVNGGGGGLHDDHGGRHDHAQRSKLAALCSPGGDGARSGDGAGNGVSLRGGRHAWRFVPGSGSNDRLTALAIQRSKMPVTIIIDVSWWARRRLRASASSPGSAMSSSGMGDALCRPARRQRARTACHRQVDDRSSVAVGHDERPSTRVPAECSGVAISLSVCGSRR